jgi:phenylpropionate dioxygenase-like ring-hydroxylating dioxygenase large terminal subunit
MQQHFWHPLVQSALVLPAGQPHSVVLFGHELVVWRTASGQVQVWRDQCPHRGAKLSMGQVIDDVLECPYHGWQFTSQGQCKLIPVEPAFKPGPAHCAKTYAVKEAYELVWVCLEPLLGSQDPAQQDVPAFLQESDARLRKVLCGPYEVQASAPRLVENFLDMAHFGFVHEHWLGDRNHVSMPPYQVQEQPNAIKATQCFAWQPKSSVHAQTGAMVEYTYEVSAPYTAVLTKIPEASTVEISDFQEAIALFVLPISDESSRVWIRLAMNDFESPDSRLQQFQDTIFSQDQPIVQSQRPKRLPLQSGEVHGPADKMSAAYRRYLLRKGIEVGVIRQGGAQ